MFNRRTVIHLTHHAFRQSGMTMIGLLIGLLISVMCILVCLSLYKNLIQIAADSKLDAQHDGQLSSAMLVTQLEIQSAGFGIPNADFSQLVVDTSDPDKRQLFWRFVPDGVNTTCRGLIEQKLDLGNGELYRSLSLVQPTSCDLSTNLTSLTWSHVLSELGRWRVYDDGVTGLGLDDYILTHKNLFQFQIASGPCSPFGTLDTSVRNHAILSIVVPSSAALQGANGVFLNQYDFCLPNIHIP